MKPHLHRRELLQAGYSSVLGLSLPGLLAGKSRAAGVSSVAFYQERIDDE